ncbi:hypothetical protein UlMin_029768 [Ulmus minor]
MLKIDNAREYFNSILGNFLLKEGIIHQSSCIDTPQQNGIVKRKNRHLLEVARSIMFSTNVPKFFWGEAVLTPTYLINQMPSRVFKFQTPCQILLKSYPGTRLLYTIPPKIFGCSVFVHIHPTHQSKLDPRAIKSIFLRYSPNQKGYKCYSPTTRKFYNSMDVTFFENQPYYPKFDIQGEHTTQEYQFWEIESSSIIESPIPILEPQISHSPSIPIIGFLDTTVESPDTSSHNIQPQPAKNSEFIVYSRRKKKKNQEEIEERTHPEQVHEVEPNSNSSEIPQGNKDSDTSVHNELQNNNINLPIAKRKGVRPCTNHPIYNFLSYNGLSPVFRAFSTSVTEIRIPNNIREALQTPQWKAAVGEEI